MNSWIISSIVIVSLGFFICLFLIFYGKRKKAQAIEHYEEIRDKLTVREKEELEEVENYFGFSLGHIISGFIAILVGFTLLPAVANEVNLASQALNVTGSAETMIGLTTMFFALAIMAAAIGIVTSGLRSSGLI